MPSIRKAKESDNPRILKILKDLDLYYEGLELKDFWVAEKDHKIIGAVQLQESENFFFLCCLSVIKEEQHKGIASSLLERVTQDTKKPVYLYTVIPEFFIKHGFSITELLPGLPSKERYECKYCYPEKCRTMVKYPDAA